MGVATIEAYGATYLSSQLFEENPVYQSNNFGANELLFVVMFYGVFGLFWIHSSYPNYVLSDVDGWTSDGDYSPGLTYDDTPSDDPDPFWAIADAIVGNVVDVENADGTTKSGEEIAQA